MIKISLSTILLSCLCFFKSATKEEGLVNAVHSDYSPLIDTQDKKMLFDISFIEFWKKFKVVIKAKKINDFLNLSTDTIIYQQERVSSKYYAKYYFTKEFSENLISSIDNNARVSFSDFGVDPSLDSYLYKYIRKGETSVKRVYINEAFNKDGSPIIAIFEFIVTNKGYRLYGFSRVG